MRIALASIHPRSLSGQIEGLVGLAQALESKGHTVKVVSAFPNLQLLGADRLWLGLESRRVFIDQPLRMTRILLRLIRTAPQVDVIQLDLPTPAFSIYADLLQSLVRIPVIVGFEAHLTRAIDLFRRNLLAQAPIFYIPRLLINNRLFARFSLRSAARYLVNTQYQKAELTALGIRPEKIVICSTILPADKISHPATAIAAMRASLPAGRIVTYVGHYNHVKGVDVLVRAFQILVPQMTDLHLVLAWSGIGSHDRVGYLLRDGALAGRVTELGPVSVPELFAASDLVVLPYRLTIGQAASPATLLEALAANVPIITSDLPVLRELTDQGRLAVLVPPDDPEQLASAIADVLHDGKQVERMLSAQREWIVRKDPDQVIREYEQLYNQVVTERQERVLQPSGRCDQLR